MTVKEFLDSFVDKDNKQVAGIFQSMRWLAEKRNRDSLQSLMFEPLKRRNLLPQLKSLFFSNALRHFEHLDKFVAQRMTSIVFRNEIAMPWEMWDPTSTVVRFVNFVVFENHVPIIEALLSTFGEFTAKSKLTPNVKMLFSMIECDAIHSMSNTKLEDVTPGLLLKWFYSFTLADNCGFEINFAFRSLVKVVRSHFGLQVGSDPVGPFVLARLDREEKITKQQRAVIDTKDLPGSVDRDQGRETSDGLRKKLDSLQLIVKKLDGEIQELDEGIEELEKKKMELVKTHEEICTRKEWLIDAIELGGQMASSNLLQRCEVPKQPAF